MSALIVCEWRVDKQNPGTVKHLTTMQLSNCWTTWKLLSSGALLQFNYTAYRLLPIKSQSQVFTSDYSTAACENDSFSTYGFLPPAFQTHNTIRDD